jgi:hypothetical protein
VDFADVCLVLEDKQAEGRTIKTLHFTKLRGVPPRRPLVLDMDEQLVFHPVWEESVVPIDLVKRVVEEYPGMQTGEAVDLLMERTGAAERTVYSALNRAERQKLIVRTPKGRAVLLFPYPDQSQTPEPVTESVGEASLNLSQPAGQEQPTAPEQMDETFQPDSDPGEESPIPVTIHTLELLQLLDDGEIEDAE